MITRAATPDLKVGPTYWKRDLPASAKATAGLAIAAILCGQGVRAPLAFTDPPLARVDAIAADARGKAVTDLKTEDFEVVENGTPRRIESVSFIPDTGPV